MEYLSQYECTISYIKEEDNTIADALSRLPEPVVILTTISAVFKIESNPKLFAQIRKGYQRDKWCASILDDIKHNMVDTKLSFTFKNGLLFIGNHLVIPSTRTFGNNCLDWHMTNSAISGEKNCTGPSEMTFIGQI